MQYKRTGGSNRVLFLAHKETNQEHLKCIAFQKSQHSLRCSKSHPCIYYLFAFLFNGKILSVSNFQLVFNRAIFLRKQVKKYVFFTVELEFKHVDVITGTFMKSFMVIKKNKYDTLNSNKQHIPIIYITPVCPQTLHR